MWGGSSSEESHKESVSPNHLLLPWEISRIIGPGYREGTEGIARVASDRRVSIPSVDKKTIVFFF